MTFPRLDPIALAGAVVCAVMAVVYVVIVRSQDSDPAAWVLMVLVLAGLAAAYASRPGAVGRTPVLLAAGVLLLGLGVLAILSIGLPILVAGALCIGAALRRRAIA